MKVHVFIINLKHRTDRLENIKKEFSGRDEFEITIVEAVKHNIGAIGLWETIIYILKNLVAKDCEYIIICEDDHQFTDRYSKKILFENIDRAKERNADVLSGGVSWFRDATRVNDELYHVEKFSGLQFTILFRSVFDEIVNTSFNESDAADYKICELTHAKYFIFPFISVQKDYGYSDVTPKNNGSGVVSELFAKSSESVRVINKIVNHYNYKVAATSRFSMETYSNVTIPTFIINLPERIDRRLHILEQFRDRSEFDIKIVEGCKHEIRAIGLWMSIRKIVESAHNNNEDIIIICEDDHTFTKDYSWEYLLKNVVEAHEQGTELLNGGVGGFGMSIPVSRNRFWVNWFYSTQFIVLYNSVFQKIINEPIGSSDTADGLFSNITSNKMILHPFISIQKDFGYSDISQINGQVEGHIDSLFQNSHHRLELNRQEFENILNK